MLVTHVSTLSPRGSTMSEGCCNMSMSGEGESEREKEGGRKERRVGEGANDDFGSKKFTQTYVHTRGNQNVTDN